MWEKIVNLAIQNGLFAVLFLGLLIFILKDSAKREKKYQQTIENLNKNLNSALKVNDEIKEIDENVKDIKTLVNKPRAKKINSPKIKEII